MINPWDCPVSATTCGAECIGPSSCILEEKCHPSHKTRSSDASSFDEICEYCGRHDITGGGWGLLAEPCPANLLNMTFTREFFDDLAAVFKLLEQPLGNGMYYRYELTRSEPDDSGKITVSLTKAAYMKSLLT